MKTIKYIAIGFSIAASLLAGLFRAERKNSNTRAELESAARSLETKRNALDKENQIKAAAAAAAADNEAFANEQQNSPDQRPTRFGTAHRLRD